MRATTLRIENFRSIKQLDLGEITVLIGENNTGKTAVLDAFPSFQALRKGAHSRELEEERRSCFVAITRAERTLTLTRAERYHGYPKAPSQFFAEMGIGTGTGR